MQVYEVDRTSRTIPQEPGEIREAGGIRAIRDSRRPEFQNPTERLHEGFIRRHAGIDGHTCALAGVTRIGLVEAEYRVRPVIRDAVVDVGGPAGRRARAVVEKQGDEG